MPVFISHKKEDSLIAMILQLELRLKGIDTFLDELDLDIDSTDDITKIILSKLDACTHLLAIVSGVTEKSWWVPFEIGAATTTDKRICTYKTGAVNLPEFLKKWPILSSKTGLTHFIDLYLADTQAGLKEASFSFKGSASRAEMFHESLKEKLGQI